MAVLSKDVMRKNSLRADGSVISGFSAIDFESNGRRCPLDCWQRTPATRLHHSNIGGTSASLPPRRTAGAFVSSALHISQDAVDAVTDGCTFLAR